MATKVKHSFWIVEGAVYGRVASFPTVEAFLTERYHYGAGWSWPQQEADGSVFFEDWKQEHPIEEYIQSERVNVKRKWCRYSFMDGGGLYLDHGEPGSRGAFELWELD